MKHSENRTEGHLGYFLLHQLEAVNDSHSLKHLITKYANSKTIFNSLLYWGNLLTEHDLSKSVNFFMGYYTTYCYDSRWTHQFSLDPLANL